MDTLTLTGPTTLPRTTTARITATFTQGTRTIPVTYPVSAHWTIGTWPPPRDVVSFDPSTGTVRALRPGTAWISVAVNGVSRTMAITVP